MSYALLKSQLKKNAKLIIMMVLLVIFYLITIIFTADFMKDGFMKDMVESMMRSFGASEAEIAKATAQMGDMTALSFTANGFFSLCFHLFLMYMYIVLVSRLIVKPVETTAMSCYLSLPLSRRRYVWTTAASLTITVLLCGLAAYLSGLFTFMIQKADVNYWDYLNISGAATLVALSVAFVSMACGFVFAGTKYKSLATAVPIVLLVLSTFYTMAESLDWLKYISIFGWADYSELANGTFKLWWLVDLGCLAVVGAATYLSLYIFKKRNLSI
jgi:hypothetical protein